MRVTPAAGALFRNKPGTSQPLNGSGFDDSSAATQAFYHCPAECSATLTRETLPGSLTSPPYHSDTGATCETTRPSDFGQVCPPIHLYSQIGDADNSGSWTSGDYVELGFDRPTNTPGYVVGTPLSKEQVFALFTFDVASAQESPTPPAVDFYRRAVADNVSAVWTDASTFRMTAVHVDQGNWEQSIPDPYQCGQGFAGFTTSGSATIGLARQDHSNNPEATYIECVFYGRSAGGYRYPSTSARLSIGYEYTLGIRLRVSVNETGGLRAASNSPFAPAVSGNSTHTLQHCYA